MNGPKITEEDLHGAGMMVVGNQAVPMTNPPGESADDDSWWGYAVAQLGFAKACEDQLLEIGRRSALHTYRAGHALSVLRTRHKEEGTWMRCLEVRKLAHSTVLQAIQLYERAKTEDAIKELTITEAKEKYEIVKPRGNLTTATTRKSSVLAARRGSVSRQKRAVPIRHQGNGGDNDSGNNNDEVGDETTSGDNNDPKVNNEETGDTRPQQPLIDRVKDVVSVTANRSDLMDLAEAVLTLALQAEGTMRDGQIAACRGVLDLLADLEPRLLLGGMTNA